MIPEKHACNLGGVVISQAHPVRIVGILNVSPESFYKDVVARDPEKIVERARQLVDAGADIIDIGGQSTAPPSIYGRDTRVSPEVEKERIEVALKTLNDSNITVPISVDTQVALVAKTALSLDAAIINDISGLKADPEMVKVLSEYPETGVILMAARKRPGDCHDLHSIKVELLKSVELAMNSGISERSIVIDPAIGSWDGRSHLIDLMILKHLDQITALPYPVLVSISRKSLIPRVMGEDIPPKDRFSGTLSLTGIAVEKGALLVRCYDPKPTIQAVTMAKAVRDFSCG